MEEESLGNPKTTWVPYMNPKDCSQGFCSLYCPQWCYIILPPPPPFQFNPENSSPRFSPLVIAIIGILASAFLLISYYAIISNFCRKRDSSTSRVNDDPDVEMQEDHDPPNNETWYFATNGLDEALVKLITVCKYKRGDGLVEGTECSVCLNEFQENESLRLLPKCSHAFHINCIDTWLRSNSNCPLCRANIGLINSTPPLQLPPLELESEILSQRDEENGHIESSEMHSGEEERGNYCVTKRPPVRVLGNLMGDVIIEIREDGAARRIRRRSMSMDNLCRTKSVSILDILGINEDDKEVQINGEMCSRQNRYKGNSHGVMKRSFSSGRFLFP